MISNKLKINKQEKSKLSQTCTEVLAAHDEQ